MSVAKSTASYSLFSIEVVPFLSVAAHDTTQEISRSVTILLSGAATLAVDDNDDDDTLIAVVHGISNFLLQQGLGWSLRGSLTS